MRRRRQDPVPAPLTEAVAAILLGGWGVHPPGVERGDAEARDGVFDLMLAHDAGLVGNWQRHEAWLRQCAATWGMEPEWYVLPRNEYGLRFLTSNPRRADGPFFFAEATAVATADTKEDA